MCKVKCTIVSIYINKLARSLLPQMHMPHVMQDCHNFCLHILELWVWSDVVDVPFRFFAYLPYFNASFQWNAVYSISDLGSVPDTDPEKQQMLSKARAVIQMKIIIVNTFSNRR